MSIKLKVAWILSILATALGSFGLVGNGTSASFSDTVTVTHEIRTGHVKLRIVKVDGQALDPPVEQQRLSDVVKNTKTDLTRVVELRNDGTIDVTSLFLTTTPGENDSKALTTALVITVQLTSETGATKVARPLAEWETAPQQVKLPSPLAPGGSLTVTMRTNGDLDGSEDLSVEPTYTFTAHAGE